MLRRRPELLVGAALLLLLVATSSGYGWHRDELYFAVAGRHPAWGYPDQPLLTPLLVAAGDAVGRGSLSVVRLVSALAGAVTAVLAGGIAAEMGGSRRARLIASATWAVGGISIVTGHFVDTSTFDVLAATAVCWCVARAIRSGSTTGSATGSTMGSATGSARWVAVAGAVLGLGLLNKLVVGFVAASLLLSLVLVGPRSVLRPRALLVAAGFAVLGAAPYLLWQAAHGWPQLALARSIQADGAEGGRVGVIPFQMFLVSPVLVPLWVAGLVRLLRRGPGRPFRAFGVAYGLYVAFVIVSGGKSYYVAGLLPPLVAAGAVATDGWLDRGRRRLRRALVTAALVLSVAVNAVVGLDVLPARLLKGPVMALNPDSGEQVGWPRFAAAVADAWRRIPPGQRSRAVVLTGNYGEAGAIDRYGPALGLPAAYSGHNAFALWGPPPANRTGAVVIVGYDQSPWLAARFTGCRRVATVDNGIGLDNDEQGDAVLLCTSTTRPWSRLWPGLRHDD